MDGTTPSLRISASLPQRRKVLSLRYMGYEVEDISGILGLAPGTVQAHINAAVNASSDKERINTVREAEMSKLEEIEEAFFPAATGSAVSEDGPVPPQASAAKVVLDVMDRRAKLLGIDKAQPPQNTTNLTLIQILSQLPPALGSSPLLPEQKLDGVTTQSPSFSREATDA